MRPLARITCQENERKHNNQKPAYIRHITMGYRLFLMGPEAKILLKGSTQYMVRFYFISLGGFPQLPQST
jgi:hypothetical protein